MKHLITLTAMAAFLVSAGFVVSQDLKPASRPSASRGQAEEAVEQPLQGNVWMKAKQHHAHNIFDGLTEGDFEKVKTGAAFMFGSGVLEKWMTDRDYVDHYAYEGQTNAFDFALKELLRHSEREDVDAALSAYVMMSQTCVRCHRLIREDKPSP